MSEEPVSESDLQAYADQRLPAERQAAVEAWLAARPEEAERIAQYQRLNEELRSAFDPVLAEPVPRDLALGNGKVGVEVKVRVHPGDVQAVGRVTR